MLAVLMNLLRKLMESPNRHEDKPSCHLCPFKDRCVAAYDDTPELPGEKHDKSFAK